MTLTHPDVREFAALTLQIQALLVEAESAQWQRSRIIAADEDDPGIRSLGEHGDPTFDAASDPARLNLRRAVTFAEDGIRRHTDSLRGYAHDLQKALDRWNGGL